MLVAIDGAQSSGKTTCWRLLRSTFRGENLVFVPEMARIVAPRFGVHGPDDWARLLGRPQELRAFFEDELALLRQLQAASTHAVIDSSALLVTAYARVFLGSGLLPPTWATYDWIFYCEPFNRPAVDGFRFVHGRNDVDETYRALLAEYHDSSKVQVLPADDTRMDTLVRHRIWDVLLGGSD